MSSNVVSSGETLRIVHGQQTSSLIGGRSNPKERILWTLPKGEEISAGPSDEDVQQNEPGGGARRRHDVGWEWEIHQIMKEQHGLLLCFTILTSSAPLLCVRQYDDPRPLNVAPCFEHNCYCSRHG